MENALGDIRTSLLEADAAVPVVDDFLGRVRERAMSAEVMRSLTPAQQVIKIVREELTQTLGGTHHPFTLPNARPAVVMMAGVQGSGKTTACAKLALHLKEKGRNPLLVAADLHRPAAVEQLFTLGSEIKVPVVSDGKNAEKVAKNALKHADSQGGDVVIVDTAGRLHVDPEMMREARRVRDEIKPHHVLMACDAMTGQDAVVQAEAFMREVNTTGFVLTKLDGDARGGAALSITGVTGRPIYFAGVGEKPGDLEAFHPDRMAQRILGMGDVMTLVEKAEREFDERKAEELERKIRKQEFTFDDFLDQLQQVRRMGPVSGLLKMIPGLGSQLSGMKIDDRELDRVQAIITSMTPEERANPSILNGSRRRRIAQGSGTNVSAVNQLVKQFSQMQKMMRSLSQGKMPNLSQLARGR